MRVVFVGTRGAEDLAIVAYEFTGERYVEHDLADEDAGDILDNIAVPADWDMGERFARYLYDMLNDGSKDLGIEPYKGGPDTFCQFGFNNAPVRIIFRADSVPV